MNNDADSEIASLRNQLFYLLITLIVLTTALTAYFYREASQSGKDLAQQQKVISGYNQGQVAVMTLVTSLGNYGVAHSDIRPLLAKYGIAAAPTQPGPNARPPGK